MAGERANSGTDMRVRIELREGVCVDVPIESRLHEAVEIQIQRYSVDYLVQRASRAIEDTLEELVDWDLRRPTAAQLNYARALAAKLGLELQNEVFLFKGSAHDYIQAHAPIVEKKKAAQTARAGNSTSSPT